MPSTRTHPSKALSNLAITRLLDETCLDFEHVQARAIVVTLGRVEVRRSCCNTPQPPDQSAVSLPQPPDQSAVSVQTVSVNGIWVSVDGIGVSVDGVGVSADVVGVSVDGKWVSVDGIGVSADTY
eukprot:9226607-Pyramimonas_sp.AAC.1